MLVCLFNVQEAKTQNEQHKAEIQLLQDRLHLETDETFRRKKTFHMVSFLQSYLDYGKFVLIVNARFSIKVITY